MSVDFTSNEGTLTCIFAGRMDTVHCMEIEKEVTEHVEKHDGNVVFDMGGVDYIASSFLRICGKVTGIVTLEKFSIIKVTPNIKKVFMISGFTKKMNIS